MTPTTEKPLEDSGAVVGASMAVAMLTLMVVAGGAFVYYRLEKLHSSISFPHYSGRFFKVVPKFKHSKIFFGATRLNYFDPQSNVNIDLFARGTY